MTRLYRRAALALLLASPALLASCGGDDGGEETPITGDARLDVFNVDDEFGATVYFDGAFIGEVGKRSSRTWQVPTGLHRVRVDNADRDGTEAEEKTYNFTTGNVVEIRVSWIAYSL